MGPFLSFFTNSRKKPELLFLHEARAILRKGLLRILAGSLEGSDIDDCRKVQR
jgi:hypothetical protein